MSSLLANLGAAGIVCLQCTGAAHWIAVSVTTAALVCASIPALLFLSNLPFFVRPGKQASQEKDSGKDKLPKLSVLIPARNESASIQAAVDAVLASEEVSLELIVLDDDSTDNTAEKVHAIAARDERVRLASAPALPDGWNGKQHACWVLASLAQYESLCFLDADVRLGPQALRRMLSELSKDRSCGLVSGFPEQITKTPLEWLLLPMIHFVLLGFLPLAGERMSSSAGFAAGCGQFLMMRREPYFSSGGHAAIRTTMHDGLLLPQLFRRHGFRTRLFDLSRDATCRMYRNAEEVWSGLSKNATEGMASPGRLPVFTMLLFCGQVLPVALLPVLMLTGESSLAHLAIVALLLGYGIRSVSVLLFRQSLLGAVFHPAGVLVLLVLQWSALFGKLQGRPATWKQRAYPPV